MKMKTTKCFSIVSLIALMGALSFAPTAFAQDGTTTFNINGVANLTGFEETPTISTPASGLFQATFDSSAQTVNFELTYQNLTSNASAAHIHLGRSGTAGGIIVPLCQGAGNGGDGNGDGNGDGDGNVNGQQANGEQACPATSGTVTGTLSAADIQEPTADVVSGGQIVTVSQGLQAGEFAELVAAVLANATYVNVHSENFPQGEIRGQLYATLSTSTESPTPPPDQEQ
jgi:hypothetical protein